jgi:hypothetical protein
MTFFESSSRASLLVEHDLSENRHPPFGIMRKSAGSNAAAWTIPHEHVNVVDEKPTQGLHPPP